MKRFTTKSAAGFSLLELMVVVAIIGVLATVAVPRFNIFRARARQGEAKSNLGVIFTLQEAFKIDKELYFNGDSGHWGGADMKDISSSVGYRGSATSATDESKNICEANKLGFRLANCAAARYQYWISAASEQGYLAVAQGVSDEHKRIFPGCPGATAENTQVNTSKSGKKMCALGSCSIATHTTSAACTGASPAGTWTGFVNPTLHSGNGDGFCLDHARTVDNFMDIVGAADCVN
ncbi:MAG: type II secretion system protein [Pseudomonadota bacterium]|nr:type II secretion system protein [Pseudomonadota bacterium]